MNENVILNNGVKMPVIGYGVYLVNPSECAKCVKEAIEVGYRKIDTAQYYGNEREVGEGIRLSKIPREQIFVTTKTQTSGYNSTKRSIDESLKKFGFPYFDLILIHWPMGDDIGSYKALEEAYKDCYTAGIIYIDPSGSMFDLCNCILDGNVQQIQSEFQKFKDRGDNILGLVSVLSNAVKAIIQVKSFINDTRGICEKTGLQQYAVQNAKKYARLYKNETLIKLMRKLLLIEKSIKNGELDSAFAVDYTVVSILGVIYFGY